MIQSVIGSSDSKCHIKYETVLQTNFQSNFCAVDKALKHTKV